MNVILILFPDYVTIASALCKSPKLYSFLQERGIVSGGEVEIGLMKHIRENDGLGDLLSPFVKSASGEYVDNPSCPELFAGEIIKSARWAGTLDTIPEIDNNRGLILLRSSSMQECSDRELAKRCDELGYIGLYDDRILHSDGSWGTPGELLQAVGVALDK